MFVPTWLSEYRSASYSYCDGDRTWYNCICEEVLIMCLFVVDSVGVRCRSYSNQCVTKISEIEKSEFQKPKRVSKIDQFLL